MTVGAWLRTRRPCPPPALARRLELVLQDALDDSAESVVEVLLLAATNLAGPLLARSDLSRESALDLLSTDALMTYAFEAAAEREHDIAMVATAAINQIADLLREQLDD